MKSPKQGRTQQIFVKSWHQLSTVKKRRRSLTNCKGCHLDYRSIQAIFPVRSPRLKGKGKTNPYLVTNPLVKKVKHTPKGAVKEITKPFSSKLNRAFKESAGVTFSEGWCYLFRGTLTYQTQTLQKARKKRQEMARNNTFELGGQEKFTSIRTGTTYH